MFDYVMSRLKGQDFDSYFCFSDMFNALDGFK